MADSAIFPFSGRVILDGNGDPLNGAKLEVFDAGTSDQQTIYTDHALTTPAANPIETNATGVVPLRYVGTADYKVTFVDSDDVTLSNYDTWDNVRGAVDTSSFLTGTVSPSRAVINKTTTYSTVAGDLGKHINADPTGGSFTISLLSAVTAGDGGDQVIKNTGSANAVTVTPLGGLTIDGLTSYILNPGDQITARSDGANYHIVEAYRFTDGIVTITYGASVTPSFAYPTGTNFQLTLTGDATINLPSDIRAGFNCRFTIIQDGTGGHEITWNSGFKGNVAINQGADAITMIGVHARTTTALDYWTETGRYVLVGLIEDQKTQNTAGGTATLGSWETRDLNTLTYNTVGITLSANEFTLPVGDYYIEWSAPAFQVSEHQSRLYDVTGTAAVNVGAVGRAATADNTMDRSEGSGTVSITAANAYRIEHQVIATNATNGYGEAGNIDTEVYTRVEIYAR